MSERKLMRKRVLLLFSLVALAAMLLSACTGVIDDQADVVLPPESSGNNVGSADVQPEQNTQPDPPASNGNEETPSNGEEPPSNSGEEQSEQPPTEEPQGEQAPALMPKPEMGYDLGAAGLVATDPNQVNLTSGELHLVEMFAFW
jgi:hypothetical protein